MISALLSRLSNRKLLIASTIVAIRNYVSHAEEYSAALKQFYFAVHPDFFGQHPVEKETNENSLKLLSDFMNEVRRKNDVKPITVNFFVRRKEKISESPNAVEGNFNRVQILLKSKHLPTLIHDILSSCQLPIQNDLENLVKSRKNQNQTRKTSKIHWSTSLKDFMEEEVIEREPRMQADTLYNWLVSNIDLARYRVEEVRPIVEENRRIIRRMIRRHRLANFVGSDTGYTQMTLNGALRQLEYLYKRRTVNTNGLQGKTLKLRNFNGLDHLGRFIIDITDVPTAWIQALVSLSDMDGLYHVLDLTEMQISEILHGLQISRSRLQEPVPIKHYYKQVSKLLQGLRETVDVDILVPPFLEKVRGKITRASDDLFVCDDGVIAIPCMSTFDAILSFLRLNYPQILEAKKIHARSLQTETLSVKSCLERLKLSHLKKDQIVSSEQMIKCCERMKREKFLGLENIPLIISNYYAISGDGEIRIPWNWIK